MTDLRTMIRQEVVFSAKVFFAPFYGAYLAVKQAWAERATNEEKDGAAAATATIPPLQPLATQSSTSSIIVVGGGYWQVAEVDRLAALGHPAFRPRPSTQGVTWHEA